MPATAITDSCAAGYAGWLPPSPPWLPAAATSTTFFAMA
jgi:hypothetical protein